MLLPTLSDTARIWLFALQNPLTERREVELCSSVERFISDWTSHGRDVKAEYTIYDKQVLVVGAHISDSEINSGISGCGIDKLQHTVDAAGESLGVAWINPLFLLIQSTLGHLEAISRAEFQGRLAQGEVNEHTPILDMTVSLLGEARMHGMLRPANETWLGTIFDFAAPARV